MGLREFKNIVQTLAPSAEKQKEARRTKVEKYMHETYHALLCMESYQAGMAGGWQLSNVYPHTYVADFYSTKLESRFEVRLNINNGRFTIYQHIATKTVEEL